MKDAMRRAFALLLLGAGLVLGGAPPASIADVPSLTVFAAADLGFAFQEIVPRFEKSVGPRVSLVSASSATLATQTEHGAPADVFFSADQAFVERLAARGAVIAESRAVYAQGRIVLATVRSFGPRVAGLRARPGGRERS